ncbi:hypothetical protein LguiA_000553 [Lonicera macranthoides]
MDSDYDYDYDYDYYGSDTAMDSDTDNNDAADWEFIDDNDTDKLSLQKKNYTILEEQDIRKRQEDDIARISAVLSVSRVASCMLLRRYNWSVSDVHEAWFADEDSVRKSIGLLEKPILLQFSKEAKEVTCGICFENYCSDRIKTAVCGHPYCHECWTAYISISINDGPGCLSLRCPDPSCDAAISQDMIHTLVCDEDKDKYDRYLLRSYIEDNRKTKWCPAPGCDCAAEYVVGSGNYDVSCLCSYSFCWNCTEETHRPVDCNTVAKWILKNSAESENVNWILANSKPCPKCKRPIEKNQGCMHMTCTPPCSFEFCWLCLGAWSNHGDRSGGYYACNRYNKAKEEGAYDEVETRRKAAKNSLERYTHYYERWASNQRSREKALEDLGNNETVNLEKLSKKQSEPETKLKFIKEAWEQIVECRRVLKWTYAYGYYLPEHQQAKRQFFEYLQGEAEAGLERLHQCAEKDLEPYLKDPSDNFVNFRIKLVGLTSVTRNYFENLVEALENGLSDVDSQAASSKASAKTAAAAAASKSNCKGRGGRGKSTSRSRNIDDEGSWACDYCTYVNNYSATNCDICYCSR